MPTREEADAILRATYADPAAAVKRVLDGAREKLVQNLLVEVFDFRPCECDDCQEREGWKPATEAAKAVRTFDKAATQPPAPSEKPVNAGESNVAWSALMERQGADAQRALDAIGFSTVEAKPVNAGDELLRRFSAREAAVQRLAKRVLSYHDELLDEGMEQLIADADAVRACGPLTPSDHVECTDSLCIWCEQDGSPREQRLQEEDAAQPPAASPVDGAGPTPEQIAEWQRVGANTARKLAEQGIFAQPEPKPVDGDVEAALAYVEKHGDGKPMFPEDWTALKTLAAEVRWLREQVARVEALVDMQHDDSTIDVSLVRDALK